MTRHRLHANDLPADQFPTNGLPAHALRANAWQANRAHVNTSRLKASLRVLAGVASISLILLQPGLSENRRINLFPKLVTGQILNYRISYHTERKAKTQSAFITAESAVNPNVDLRALLRLEVLGLEARGARFILHARTTYQTLDTSAESAGATSRKPATPEPVSPVPQPVAVEFTISPDGRVSDVKNLDVLPPDQQEAWKEWVARFAAGAAFPEKGIALAEKWKSEEPEKTASPIAGLTWIRESVYLRNEPCRPMKLTPLGDFASSSDVPAETCAVIFTSATLKQKSSPDKTTPEDFKLHDLHTNGTASGDNKTVLYISLSTGLLVRSSDDADQRMDVTIATSDLNNHVHYAIHAQSSAEIFLLTAAPIT
jgi:hypothetical protein